MGLVWFALIHVVPDPRMFLDQVEAFGQGLPLMDLPTQPATVVALEVARYFLVEPRVSAALVVAVVVAAVFLLLRRRDRSLLVLLTFGFSVFLFMMLFSGTKVAFYAVLLVPIGTLLLARLVDILPTRSAWLVGGGTVALSLVSIAVAAVPAIHSDFDRYVAGVRSYLPEGTVIQATPSLWYGLSDYEFIASPYFMAVGPYEDEARRLGIDFIVGDDTYYRPGCDTCLDVGPEVSDFVAEHTELIAELHDPHYGDVPAPDGDGYITRIYRVTEG